VFRGQPSGGGEATDASGNSHADAQLAPGWTVSNPLYDPANNAYDVGTPLSPLTREITVLIPV
jgi:hypothetical protein